LSLRELSKAAVKECKTLSARLSPSRSDRESKTRARSQKNAQMELRRSKFASSSLCAETIQVSLPPLLSHPIFIAAARTNFYLRRALIFRINSISEVVIFNL
jgi:hypothetical protein